MEPERQAGHGAFRRRQPARHRLRAPRRLRHRGVRAAVWSAPRVLHGHLAETMRREMHRNTQPVHDISREVIMRISLRSGLLALATGTVLTSAMFLHVLPAHAADLSTMRAPALAPATYNWSGAYVGANFGFAFDREDVTAPLGIFATDPSGVLGGVQLGYNYLFSSSWLLGIEGEFDWTSAAGNTNFNNVAAVGSVTSDHNLYGTLDG